MTIDVIQLITINTKFIARKPEKTVKSTCEQTRIEESENEEKIMNELDQVTTEIPESNLTIVEAVPSDDDFNGISEGEKENNENDKKVKKKKTYKTEADSKEKTGVYIHTTLYRMYILYNTPLPFLIQFNIQTFP